MLSRSGDFPDVVKLFKECSLCLIAAKDDKWSQSSDEIYQVAKDSFVGKEFFVKSYESAHEFIDEMKRDSYAFLDRVLS